MVRYYINELRNNYVTFKFNLFLINLKYKIFSQIYKKLRKLFINLY